MRHDREEALNRQRKLHGGFSTIGEIERAKRKLRDVQAGPILEHDSYYKRHRRVIGLTDKMIITRRDGDRQKDVEIMYRGKVVKYVAHSYTPEGEVNYSEMTIQQRAQHLLKIGVVAKTDFNSELLEFGYAAHVAGVGKLPVGLFETSGAAIKAGAEWLEEKALERGC